MSREPITAQQQMSALLVLLEQGLANELDCELSGAQLSILVEAERAGENIDVQPVYAALLRHLDCCASCLDLYAGLAEDMDALANAGAIPTHLRQRSPVFFAPVRQSESVVLRILRGMQRRFELTLALPLLAPTVATLSGGQRATLFTDSLVEVPGAPFVSVSVSTDSGMAELLVAVRETAQTRWQVRCVAGNTTYIRPTDDRGIVRFSGLQVVDLKDVTLSCTEILDQ